MSHKIADIRMIKKDDHKRFEDYAFIDNNNIELRKVGNENDDSNPSSSSYSNNKKYKENVFKLRDNPKKDMKSRNKSRLVGGPGTQSHSPVYE
jgi:hypothetical protein